MKVLFVSSGNSKTGLSPIVLNQGESLKKEGVELDYFVIKGKGSKGYLQNIPKLKKVLSNNYDIVHAHYSFSGILASLSGASPIIVSLMGSDTHLGRFNLILLKLLKWFFSWKIIIKSESMNKRLQFTKPTVVPNGVNMDLFKPLDKTFCQDKLGWNQNNKYVLFAANKNRFEKNFPLAKKSVDMIMDKNIILIDLNNVLNKEIPIWFNAADLVILSSLWEGSPNVIKEAMACNRPIVTTDVGDVRWLFGNASGHFISQNDPDDFTKRIKEGLFYSKKQNVTSGRKRIQKLELSSESVSKKLLEIYKQTIE